MKYRCGHCDEDHDISDLTINIGDEGHKVRDDLDTAVMDIVEKRRVPLELLIYALAALLEETKQTGLKLGDESHRIEMIIQVARNDMINAISKNDQ
jgi:transcription antitermination factor NusA-like protein